MRARARATPTAQTTSLCRHMGLASPQAPQALGIRVSPPRDARRAMWRARRRTCARAAPSRGRGRAGARSRPAGFLARAPQRNYWEHHLQRNN